MKHTCHAMRCTMPVPPRMFMCKDHWYRLPRNHQRAILDNYVPGQEKRKDPSPQYMLAQTTAVLAMGVIDGVDAGALRVQRKWVDYWQKVVNGEIDRAS